MDTLLLTWVEPGWNDGAFKVVHLDNDKKKRRRITHRAGGGGLYCPMVCATGQLECTKHIYSVIGDNQAIYGIF